MIRKSIAILESNVGILNELKSEFLKNGNFEIVYAGDDGEAGVKEIVALKPNVVIVGMFLKGLDGCGVIREIKRSCDSTVILATGVSSDSLMEKAILEGADYYLVKPFSIPFVLERISEFLRETRLDGRGKDPIRKKPVSLDEKISDIFISIGIPPHIKGYSYLREGIKTTVQQPYIINNVTKGLYPSIAKTFETTPSKVERAIRHAIEVAWNRGRIDAINAVFGSRVYLGSEKPTNSEFIALVADKLILENLI